MLLVVTNRNRARGGFGGKVMPTISYRSGPELEVDGGRAFRSSLLGEFRRQAAAGIKRPVGVLVIHGYNCNWEESIETFRKVEAMLEPLEGPPIVVGFSWPSEGRLERYLDDRADARASAEALTALMIDATRLLEKERCVANLAVVAHSMGNYLLATAAHHAWGLRGRPREHNIFSEVLMLAPDLDAEALGPAGEAHAIPVFARRVTVYHSRNDMALLASAAKRLGVTGPRLGRQGPADPYQLSPNVVAVDCSRYVTEDGDGGSHSGYFHQERILEDIRSVLDGADRMEIAERTSVTLAPPPPCGLFELS